MSSPVVVDGEFPAKLAFLFDPHRYKVLYGGRGAAKSWGAARALLLLGVQRPLRILCCREIQRSIDDSVHQLLRDQIEALHLEGAYLPMKDEIRSRINGTSFNYAGLRHNVDNIKSKEALDIVWVEEAHNVSKASWSKLIPTLRKEGSEIWITFNPELETDATYVRFVRQPPATAKVVKIGWRDNPWFPPVLRQEMEELKVRDPDEYAHVYGGECRRSIDGAIYALELRQAAEEGRICPVPYDPVSPVETFWDLGQRDHTSIWFAQFIGFEYRIIDFYESQGRDLDHYIGELEARPYAYGTHWLPHDGAAVRLGMKKSVEAQLRDGGRRQVRVLTKPSVAHGIAAARSIFPNCYFDEDKCADGLNRLRHYKFDVDPDTKQYSATPLHDENSDAADAFRYLAIALKEQKPKKKAPKIDLPDMRGVEGSWLAR